VISALPTAGAAPTVIDAARHCQLDSSTFYKGDQKLGFGSSAAVTVAQVGFALAKGLAHAPPTETALSWQQKTYRIASIAHAAAQKAMGAGGSGIDIAAATFGNLLAYQKGKHVHLPLPHLTWIGFVAGAPASTTQLLKEVAAAASHFPSEVNAAKQSIAAAALDLRDATQTPQAFIAAFAQAGLAMQQLAEATRLPLVPPTVATAASLAATFGGAAKTTGAGAGDIGLCVVLPQHAEDLRNQLELAGLAPFVVDIAKQGVSVEFK